jgi:GT2 family glycosyltransferase
MRVSVVIVTFNRAQRLGEALGALAAQEAPPALLWEILVVDNNSRDRTEEVVSACARSAPMPVRYVREPRQGISHARNRGTREARGSIVAFTDDDVFAAPDWVARIAAAFDRWDAHGVGGRILPRWEGDPPRWLTESRHLLNRLAIMDSPESRLLALPLNAPPYVWGANMAFRRELFETIGGFDPRRGIVGSKLSRGEEVDLIHRAIAADLRVAYDPSLTVYHRIGPDRLRKSYFRRLVFDEAEGRARVASGPSGPTLLGAPRGLYGHALTGLLGSARWLPWGGASGFHAHLRWLDSIGELWGHWTARRRLRIDAAAREAEDEAPSGTG